MKKIALTGGLSAIVDDNDYARLSEHSWQARRSGNSWYAYRVDRRAATKVTSRNGKTYWAGRNLAMHQAVLQSADQIDHRNGNTLDNRRANLRRATHGQNMQHRGKFNAVSAGSRYKGVSPRRGKFRARITAHGHTINLGDFVSEVEAAIAYDSAAHSLHGDFAVVNFPVPRSSRRK